MTNNPNPMVLDPEAIWLEPQCAEYGDGRTWANPAPEVSCDDCGLPWVKYVRADLALSTSTAPATEEGCGWPTISERPNHDAGADEVERVARALARHDNPKHENWWPSYERRAHAAILALRPSRDKLVEALLSELLGNYCVVRRAYGLSKREVAELDIVRRARAALAALGEGKE